MVGMVVWFLHGGSGSVYVGRWYVWWQWERVGRTKWVGRCVTGQVWGITAGTENAGIDSVW